MSSNAPPVSSLVSFFFSENFFLKLIFSMKSKEEKEKEKKNEKEKRERKRK